MDTVGQLQPPEHIPRGCLWEKGFLIEINTTGPQLWPPEGRLACEMIFLHHLQETGQFHKYLSLPLPLL